LWSANSGDNTVSRINPTSGAVEQTIVVGESPTAITVTGDDVWVADGGARSVSRINALSKTVVATVEVGNLPSAIDSGPSGVWVANGGDDTIQRIDPVSGRPGDPISVGGEPSGVSVGRDTVWVTNSQDGTVSRISTLTGQAASPIPVGAGPRGIAATEDAIWVANGLELTLSRIDPVNARVVATIPVGDGPHSVVAGPHGVWVSGEFDGSLTKIDPATNTAVQRIATGASPRGLAAVGSSLWVATASFTNPDHRGGTLRVTIDGPLPVDSIDPALSYNLGTSAMLYDGLVALRRVGGAAGATLVPDLATTLPRPTDGGRTYTFNVRRGIRYSNGAEVRPDDIRRGLQRTLALRHGDPGYYLGIIGARACAAAPDKCDLSRGVQTDDANSTIAFHLIAPDPDFLHKLALFVLATAPGTPMHESRTPLPATGPYMISHYKPGGPTFTLVRNPHFRRWSFAAKPDGYPDVLRWTTAPNSRVTVADVISGRSDLTRLASDPAVMADLGQRYPTRLHSDFAMGTFFEWLNTRVPHSTTCAYAGRSTTRWIGTSWLPSEADPRTRQRVASYFRPTSPDTSPTAPIPCAQTAVATTTAPISLPRAS
jgi:YVTN family beta-propeller protein